MKKSFVQLLYFSFSKDMPPCMNCLLIEMGEMACYTERCQECGRIPPGRKAFPCKKVKPPEMLKKLVGRRLSGKKSVKVNELVNLSGHLRTSQLGPHSLGRPPSQYQHRGEKYSLKVDTANSRRKVQQDSMV